MEHYVIPVIHEEPSNIILQVETNDIKNLPSRTILNNHLKLKVLVKDSVPTGRVLISTVKLRLDDGKAQMTIIQLKFFFLIKYWHDKK